MYKVLIHFVDLQDENYPYNTGDIFPREGKVVNQKRLDELSSTNNRRGIKLIEKIEGVEKKETKKKKSKE